MIEIGENWRSKKKTNKLPKTSAPNGIETSGNQIKLLLSQLRIASSFFMSSEYVMYGEYTE